MDDDDKKPDQSENQEPNEKKKQGKREVKYFIVNNTAKLELTKEDVKKIHHYPDQAKP